MNISVLHIDDCPNWREAGELVAQAVSEIGRPDISVDYVVIDTPEMADRYGFAGSPTISVDGEDLFADGARTNDLACRIYRTSTGFAGYPTLEQIRDAIEARLRVATD